MRVAVHDKADKADKNVAYETCMLSAPAGSKWHLPLVRSGWHPRPDRLAGHP